MFSTSTVLPESVFRTSPGFCAVPEGMFSVAAMMPTMRTGSRRTAATLTVARTAAAPDMSYFICSIFAAGLRLKPPESKVIPLPQRANVAFARRGAYSMTMNCAGWALPCATPTMPPNPSRLSCGNGMTRHLSRSCRLIARAWLARKVGVTRFDGPLIQSRASATAWATTSALAAPRFAGAASPARSTTSVRASIRRPCSCFGNCLSRSYR